MSISSISSGSTVSYPANSAQKDVRNAFRQVADAIDHNDLQGAQSAFDDLASLLNGDQQSPSSGSSSSQNANSSSDPANLLSQLGSALQSGDLDQAKDALQNLRQMTLSARYHRHHHHGGGGSDVAAIQTTQSPSNTPGTTDSSSVGSVNLTV